MGNIHAERIDALRRMMLSKDWDAVIVTGSDPHSSEYPAARWKQVEWLSGFTGEAGDLLITLDHAGLWTDSRYFIQAVEQLDGTGIELHKARIPGEPDIPQWLERQFGSEGMVVVDGLCISAQAAEDLPGNVISMPDLLGYLWQDRPPVPKTPVYTVETGMTRADKIASARRFLEDEGCDAILLTALDQIAWLLNVRASDIEFNPFVISYLLVDRHGARWYVEKDGEQDEQTCATFSILEADGIDILPYSDITYLAGEISGRLCTDPSTLNYTLYSNLLSMGVPLKKMKSPVDMWKAVKNPFEQECMRKIHIEDGAAMERFLFWLEKSLESGKRTDERDASEELDRIRSGIGGYKGNSFETISAYGPGAALPHYKTPSENAPELHPRGLYLCDSGGQYLSGTTDITRTVPLGPCSRLEMEDYTLVLRSHIDLARAVFPKGTPGCRIDALAREALWRSKRDFGHGTGHGVGFFLGVHEGPQDIRQNLNATPLVPGMVCSDEPGIYREGKHGVRHENLLICVEAGSNEFGSWLEFEPLTMCHFDTSAIIPELLGYEQALWLDAYNEKVYRTLSPLLPQEISEWLREKTRPVAGRKDRQGQS